MKTFVAAATIAAAVSFVGSANAADMPVKAPVAVAAPFSWTGFYVGGSVGAAWTKAAVSLNTVNGAAPLYNATDIPGLNALGSPNITATNAIFGAKLGYNQQWGRYVLGLEGDISSFRFNKTTTTAGNPFLAFPGGSANFANSASTNWLVTVRPRIGYTFDRAFVFATGGLAFGKVSFSDNYVGFSPNGAGFEFQSSAASQTKTGWSAGAGVDYALTNNWILSAEYLHVDLGSISVSGLVTTGNANTATMNFSTKLTTDVVRGGVAYKF